MKEKIFEGFLSALSGKWGKHFVVLDEVGSTNQYMLENDFPVGTVVTCMRQTAGRGRSGRNWGFCPGGSLAFSLALPYMEPKQLPGAQIIAGFAMVDALSLYASLRVKWPNDVVHLGKKFAGLLVDTQFNGSALKKAVLGIGANIGCVPEGMEDRAIFLKECAAGGLPGLGALLASMVNALEKRYTDYLDNRVDIVKEWGLYSENWMKTVSFHRNGVKVEVKEVGITQEGFLRVENEAGIAETINTGEIGYDFGF